MESEAIHALTAAYALDALDDADEREYEEHLRVCPRCREELASLQEAASALAYGVVAPAPPPALRQRILEQATSERENVVPFRSRRPFRAAVAVAAAAACLALGLGIWAGSLSRSLDRERQARARQDELVSILSDPGARQVPLSGASGRLVVSLTGKAALVLSDVKRAPEGKTYEVWVIDGGKPQPAGLFEAESGREAVALTRAVPEGATVAVTLEQDGGVKAPTGAPLFSAET